MCCLRNYRVSLCVWTVLRSCQSVGLGAADHTSNHAPAIQKQGLVGVAPDAIAALPNVLAGALAPTSEPSQDTHVASVVGRAPRGPVSRILYLACEAAAIYLVPPLPEGIVRPTRGLQPGAALRRAETSPYLALLRVGFASIPACTGTWCALTAPFHACLSPASAGPSALWSLWHFPSHRCAWALPSTLPGGVRTFLPGDAGAAARPS